MQIKCNERHEITLRFESSDELFEFARQYRDKIININDYQCYTLINDDKGELNGNDD